MSLFVAAFLATALSAQAEVRVSPTEATCAQDEFMVFEVSTATREPERRVIGCPSCAGYTDGEVFGLSLFGDKANGDREQAVVPVTMQCPQEGGIFVLPAVLMFLLGIGVLVGTGWATSQIEPV